MKSVRGQGATEYLVLLAVVLIIALVSIALLGFFPGAAGDSQKTESRLYWQSASPIAIVDSSPSYYMLSGHGAANLIWIKLRNTGTNTITITKLLGGDGYSTSHALNLRLAPGEENCIGNVNSVYTTCPYSFSWIQTPATPTDYNGDILRGADTMCDTNGKGRLAIRNFGMEYTVTVEGQTVTKRQMGKTFMADCSNGPS